MKKKTIRQHFSGEMSTDCTGVDRRLLTLR